MVVNENAVTLGEVGNWQTNLLNLSTYPVCIKLEMPLMLLADGFFDKLSKTFKLN